MRCDVGKCRKLFVWLKQKSHVGGAFFLCAGSTLLHRVWGCTQSENTWHLQTCHSSAPVDAVTRTDVAHRSQSPDHGISATSVMAGRSPERYILSLCHPSQNQPPSTDTNNVTEPCSVPLRNFSPPYDPHYVLGVLQDPRRTEFALYFTNPRTGRQFTSHVCVLHRHDSHCYPINRAPPHSRQHW